MGNTAHASSDEDTADRPARDSVEIVEDVHLSVTKTFDSDTVTAGGAAQSFTVDVHNSGVSDADNVSLTDTVDSRLVVDSVTAGGYTCPNGDANAQTITCTLAHLAAGATQSITVHYHVATTTNSDPSVAQHARQRQSDEDGPTSGSDTVAIVEDVTLSVTKTFNSDTVTAGGASQTFTVSVHNSGVSDADNVSLTDTVDGAPARRLDRRRQLHVRPGGPVDRLHARASRGRRHEVDHGHVPRRHDHEQRGRREQHGERRRRTRNGPTSGQRHGRHRRERAA